MLWSASYLSEYRGINPNTAATFAMLFFIGITVGRFFCGFISEKVGDKNLIRYGAAVIALGIILVLMPITAVSMAGLIVVGLGCAPIYPSIIHSTPNNFGAKYSQAIIGIEMASAYVGSTFMPPLFGFIANNTSMAVFPIFMAVFLCIMFAATTRLNHITSGNLK